MKIRVQDVDKRATGYHVHFTCGCGGGLAAWHGPAPIQGMEYCVELECGERLCWGENIRPVKSRMCRMHSGPDYLRVTGLLESADGDGLVTIRLCNDLITLMAAGPPPAPGAYVEFRVCGVTLHSGAFLMVGGWA